MMINNFFNNEIEIENYLKKILNSLSLFIGEEGIKFNNLKKVFIKNNNIKIDDFIFVERLYYLNNNPSIKIENFTYIENIDEKKKISFLFEKKMLKDVFNFYFKSNGDDEEIIDFSKELSESFTNEFKLKFNEINKEKEIIFNNDFYNLNFLEKECDLEDTEEYFEVNFNIQDKEYFLLIKPFVNDDNLEIDENIENEYNNYKETSFSELICSLRTLNAYLNGLDYEKEKAFNKIIFILILLNFKNNKKVNYNLLYNYINEINESFKNNEVTETNIFDNDIITSNVNMFFLCLKSFISNSFEITSKDKDYLISIVDDSLNTFFYEYQPKTELINKENFDEIKDILSDEIDELINNIINDNKERNLKIIQDFSNIEKINDVLLLIDNDTEGLSSLKQQTNFDIENFVQERLDVVLNEDKEFFIDDIEELNCLKQQTNFDIENFVQKRLDVVLDEDKEENTEDYYVNLDEIVVKNIDDLLNSNVPEEYKDREKDYLNINFNIDKQSDKIKLSLSENEINNLLDRADDFLKDKEIKTPINFNIDEQSEEIKKFLSKYNKTFDKKNSLEKNFDSISNEEIEQILENDDNNFNPLSKEEIERMLDACDDMEEENTQSNIEFNNDFTYLLNKNNDTDIKVDFYKFFKFLDENKLHLNNVEKSINILKYILKNEETNKLNLMEILDNFDDITYKNNLENDIKVNDLEKKLFSNETSLNSLNDLLKIRVVFYFNNIIIDDKNLIFLIKFLENSIIDDLTLKVSLDISSKIINLDNIIIKIDKNLNVIVLNN